jgi:ribosome-associated protein
VMEAISNKKGWDVVLLDIRPVSLLADYFVIATGANERQVKAILEEVSTKTREVEEKPLRVEGTPESGWVLLDYGSVIVHLFTPSQREYYHLEGLWSDAPLVVRIQ